MEFREGDKKWLYSLHFYQENKTNIYYHCLDTKCKARAIYYFNFNNAEDEINNKFEIKNEHSLAYDEHNYIQSNIIKEDLETKSKSEIKKKLVNYYYLKSFIKQYLINNTGIIHTGISLKKEIESIYGSIKIDYKTIREEDIIAAKTKFKKKIIYLI